MTKRNIGLKIFYIAIISTLLCIVSIKTKFITPIDGFFYDTSLSANFYIKKFFNFQNHDPSQQVSSVVIAIDESTLSAPEAQVPRAMFSPLFADITRKVLNAGAEKVIFDVVMEFDTARWSLSGVERPEKFKKFDLGFLLLLRKYSKDKRIVLARTATAMPAKRFQTIAGSEAVAFAELPLDGDGVIRQIPLELATKTGAHARTLIGAALQREHSPDRAQSLLAPQKRITTLIPSVPMIDVMRCNDNQSLRKVFEGRMVFVGSVLPDEDRVLAPDRLIPTEQSKALGSGCNFSTVNTLGGNVRSIPGVFYHAAATDSYLRELDAHAPSNLLVGLAALLASCFAVILALGASPGLAAIALIIVSLIAFVASIFLVDGQVVFPLGRTLLIMLVAFIAGWGFKILVLERRAISLRRSFSFYLAPQLVERLAASEDMPRLDGETREITVMFADLSGFTKLSERVDSATLTKLVNRYLSAIAQEVDSSGGYVDKFIGDAVMAIWNAPAEIENHAAVAVMAAQKIEQQILIMAAMDTQENGLGFDVKAAINTGLATVGNVGAEHRLSYSAVGETVNIAARLENLGPLFGLRIVVGPETARAVQEELVMLSLADVLVPGKSTPITISTPIAMPSEISDEANAFKGAYEKALEDVREGNFEKAQETWKNLALTDFPAAKAANFMANSTLETRSLPPIDGIFGYIKTSK